MKLQQVVRNIRGNGNQVFADILKWSPYLRAAEFKIDATTHLYTPVAAGAAPANRAIGGSYTPSDQNPTPLSASLAIYGKSEDIDRSILADAERGLLNMNDWLAAKRQEMGLAFAEGIEPVIFNGAGIGTTLKGWSVLLDGATALPGLGITGVVDAAAGGILDTADSANFYKVRELLLNAIASVKNATHICMNKEMKARLTTIAIAQHGFSTSLDQFGMPVEKFFGVPMVELNDGAILNTEASGESPTPSNTTTSIYIFNFSELFAYHATNGFEYTEDLKLEGKESGRITLEVRLKNEIIRKRAVRRIRYLKV